jgi:hypothetical protein
VLDSPLSGERVSGSSVRDGALGCLAHAAAIVAAGVSRAIAPHVERARRHVAAAGPGAR